MKYLILGLIFVNLSACADMKFRYKNYNGERSKAQMDKDWKDCYQYSNGQNQMQKCIDKKGYYLESFEE